MMINEIIALHYILVEYLNYFRDKMTAGGFVI